MKLAASVSGGSYRSNEIWRKSVMANLAASRSSDGTGWRRVYRAAPRTAVPRQRGDILRVLSALRCLAGVVRRFFRALPFFFFFAQAGISADDDGISGGGSDVAAISGGDPQSGASGSDGIP
jgi:hypothetical protein